MLLGTGPSGNQLDNYSVPGPGSGRSRGQLGLAALGKESAVWGGAEVVGDHSGGCTILSLWGHLEGLCWGRTQGTAGEAGTEAGVHVAPVDGAEPGRGQPVPVLGSPPVPRQASAVSPSFSEVLTVYCPGSFGGKYSRKLKMTPTCHRAK